MSAMVPPAASRAVAPAAPPRRALRLLRALPLALLLGACNQNRAIGNDREAQLDPAPTPARIEPVAEALRNVAPTLIKPEAMSAADLQALGGRHGRCAFQLTGVAFPSFLYEPERQGAIKLNGRLILMAAAGENRFASGDLVVALRLLDEKGDAGLQGQEMIIAVPGVPDELGHRGYVRCYDSAGS